MRRRRRLRFELGLQVERHADGVAGLQLSGVRRPRSRRTSCARYSSAGSTVRRARGRTRSDLAEWWSWGEFLDAAADPESGLSPWAREQAPLVDAALSASGNEAAPLRRPEPPAGDQPARSARAISSTRVTVFQFRIGHAVDNCLSQLTFQKADFDNPFGHHRYRWSPTIAARSPVSASSTSSGGIALRRARRRSRESAWSPRSRRPTGVGRRSRRPAGRAVRTMTSAVTPRVVGHGVAAPRHADRRGGTPCETNDGVAAVQVGPDVVEPGPGQRLP